MKVKVIYIIIVYQPYSKSIVEPEREEDKKWTLEVGPFPEEVLQTLPDDQAWSLVINELDSKIPAMNSIITDLFPQFPRWRISDIQASVSPEDGGVGAHSDTFDVFLTQAIGDTPWSVADNEAYWPDKDESFVPNQDVRILKEFVADDSFLLKLGGIVNLKLKERSSILKLRENMIG